MKKKDDAFLTWKTAWTMTRSISLRDFPLPWNTKAVCFIWSPFGQLSGEVTWKIALSKCAKLVSLCIPHTPVRLVDQGSRIDGHSRKRAMIEPSHAAAQKIAAHRGACSLLRIDDTGGRFGSMLRIAGPTSGEDVEERHQV